MTPAELQAKLHELAALSSETEWVEFKLNDHGEAKYPEIGEYLSAIANSLALLRRDRGYIVWGVNNVTHELAGTDFRPRLAKVGNEELENWLTRLLTPQIRFWIHEGDFGGKHFVVIEVSPATHTPVRFSGEEYIRVGSLKKKLKDHPEKERELWQRLAHQDWSAQVCEGATLNDLDPQAIAFARQEFKKKHTALAGEVDQWDEAKREDIDKLLLSKLSDALAEEQKAHWIKNLLQEMRREGTIQKAGAEAGPGAKWVLSKPDENDGT
jgi:ATP-dependent DNA helicase RecG